MMEKGEEIDIDFVIVKREEYAQEIAATLKTRNPITNNRTRRRPGGLDMTADSIFRAGSWLANQEVFSAKFETFQGAGS